MRGRGFTLVEALLAISIAAAVLVVAFGGLRVGLAAWQKGEARSARLDHARGVGVLLARALDGAFPYRFTPDQAQEPRILFDGQADRLTFATLAPPFPAPAPIAVRRGQRLQRGNGPHAAPAGPAESPRAGAARAGAGGPGDASRALSLSG
jgi:type II secretory pathway component PulJ